MHQNHSHFRKLEVQMSNIEIFRVCFQVSPNTANAHSETQLINLCITTYLLKVREKKNSLSIQ